MTITIEDIARTQNNHLKTISSKLIYLMIKNQTDEQGWATLSFASFSKSTGMPIKSIIRVLSRFESVGLIEKNHNKPHPNSTNQYRIIEL